MGRGSGGVGRAREPDQPRVREAAEHDRLAGFMAARRNSAWPPALRTASARRPASSPRLSPTTTIRSWRERGGRAAGRWHQVRRAGSGQADRAALQQGGHHRGVREGLATRRDAQQRNARPGVDGQLPHTRRSLEGDMSGVELQTRTQHDVADAGLLAHTADIVPLRPPVDGEEAAHRRGARRQHDDGRAPRNRFARGHAEASSAASAPGRAGNESVAPGRPGAQRIAVHHGMVRRRDGAERADVRREDAPTAPARETLLIRAGVRRARRPPARYPATEGAP